MKPQWERFYSELLTDINRCKSLDLAETERQETCFRIASDHWKKIKELCHEIGFKSDAEEIEFFREVKPQFTCHIEYFMFVYHAGLVVSGITNDIERLGFWQEEALKYKRFYDRNEEFIKYYESGYRYKNREYFLRASAKQTWMTNESIYQDQDLRTSHDGIVRVFKANKMYHDYVKEKIAELKEKKT